MLPHYPESATSSGTDSRTMPSTAKERNKARSHLTLRSTSNFETEAEGSGDTSSRVLDDNDCDIASASLSSLSLGDTEDYVTRPAGRMKFKNGTRHSMTFTNEKCREIERINAILLRKIMDKKKPNRKAEPSMQKVTTGVAGRLKQQKKIDLENALLERKLREAKSLTKTGNVAKP